MVPRIAFICPFNLDRLSGTPIRTKVTIEAVQSMCEACILATGGELPQIKVLTKVWQERDRRPPLFRLDRFTKEVLRKLRVFKPNVIHAITSAAVLPAILYKMQYHKTRVILETHGLTRYEMRNASLPARLIFDVLDRMGMVFADAIITMSYSQRDILSHQFRVKIEKMHVLWGPVNLHFFKYMNPAPAPPFYVGYLGNDMFWQGLDTIFSAARLLHNREDVHFLLGGFNPADYKQLDHKNVTFAGVISRDNAPMFLSRCHILLSTRISGSVSESQYPFKLSAYLAVGRPIIASDVNDQTMILKKADCGINFPSQNAEALAEAIIRMLELPEDRRLQMGLNARYFAESYLSDDYLAKSLMELYHGRKINNVIRKTI